MIVIYTLMTSIIFSSRSKNKVLGQMQYTCSRCGRPAFHALVRTRRWFTLYFLPVIPMSKTTTLRCNLCGFQELVDNDRADAWFPQGQSGVPDVPQRTPKE